MTAEARRYGFHATLKAPFRLAERFDERDLLSGFDSFCALDRPRPSIRLEVKAVMSFLALCPVEDTPALSGLAEAAVMHFEPFRAPLNSAEIARRLESPLTDPQRGYLARYGYPYVMDEFRFHMTLTGPVHFELRERVLEFLRHAFSRSVTTELTSVDRIALFRQDQPQGRFRIIHSASLR